MPSRAMPRAQIVAWARSSWICPAAAWASQILFVLLMRVVPQLGILGLPLLIVQIMLLLCGTFLGFRVLTQARARVPTGSWWAAMVGTLLSAGTFALFLLLVVWSFWLNVKHELGGP